MVAEAREQLFKEDPEFYQMDLFRDEAVFASPIEDLNGDGLDDFVVAPGLQFSGANVEMTIFLTSDADGMCTTSYAGTVGAVSQVAPAPDGVTTDEVRDVVATNVSGCNALELRYVFNQTTGRFVDSGALETTDLCACPTNEDLIASARSALVADDPDLYPLDLFRDEIADVRVIEDLNGDGQVDLIVAPGMSYAGSNVEMAIFLSREGTCEMEFAGSLGGVSTAEVARDEATTNGVRDVVGTNILNCDGFQTQFHFDGTTGRYVAGASTTIDLCE